MILLFAGTSYALFQGEPTVIEAEIHLADTRPTPTPYGESDIAPEPGATSEPTETPEPEITPEPEPTETPEPETSES